MEGREEGVVGSTTEWVADTQTEAMVVVDGKGGILGEMIPIAGEMVIGGEIMGIGEIADGGGKGKGTGIEISDPGGEEMARQGVGKVECGAKHFDVGLHSSMLAYLQSQSTVSQDAYQMKGNDWQPCLL